MLTIPPARPKSCDSRRLTGSDAVVVVVILILTSVMALVGVPLHETLKELAAAGAFALALRGAAVARPWSNLAVLLAAQRS